MNPATAQPCPQARDMAILAEERNGNGAEMAQPPPPNPPWRSHRRGGRNGGNQRHEGRRENQVDPNAVFIKHTRPHKKRYFGDKCTKKADHTFHVFSNNIHGVQMDQDSPQMRKVIQNIDEYDVDIKLMQETNVAWNKISVEDQIQACMFGQVPLPSCVTAHNTTVPWPTKHQPGGTAILLTEQATCRQCGRGKDPTGLGRWTWMPIQGKQGVKVRMFSAYQPNCLNHNGGDTTVVAQHQHYYTTQSTIATNVRDRFVADFSHAVQEALDDGELIIVGIDVNDTIAHCDYHPL